jgi:two-component system, NtrC family, response regulator AtoC
MAQENILVIDDEKSICDLLDKVLKHWDFQVEAVSSSQEALRAFQPGKFDLVLTDLKMPGLDGLQLLKELKRVDPYIEVIIMTGFGTIENVVESMKQGASDYITKPINLDHLKIVVDKALKMKRALREIDELRVFTDEREKLGPIIGRSLVMKKIYRLIERISKTTASVLIQGETGTGKEVVARAIHLNGPRRDQKFIPVACGAVPETLLESELFGYEPGAFTGALQRKKGLVEEAHQGVLFLDEMAATVPSIQVKLLRFLQEREFTRLGGTEPISVDIQLISATNKDLAKEVRKGNFREDLFYRINVVTINLPPLRERKEDIPLLAEHFLEKFSEGKKNKIKISSEVMLLLSQYHWPGNVRELENVIERMVSLDTDGVVTPADLPDNIAKAPFLSKSVLGQGNPMDLNLSLKEVRTRAEKEHIGLLLKATKGNVSKTARQLGLTRSAFYEKLKTYHINPKKPKKM